MRKTLLSTLATLLVCVGCGHAQMPPTVHTVSLTWKATTSGGTGPYTYVMSRYTLVAADNGKCPTPNVSTPNYTPLNSASPVSAVAYTDSGATGLTVCYTVQALDASTPPQTSQPSNTAGPYTVPTTPNSPQTLGGNVTAAARVPQPPLAKPAEGSDAPAIVATLEGHVR